MINRRSFLRLVRNRVAAGILCSGMLSERLLNQPILDLLDDPAYDKLGVVVRGTFAELLKPGLEEEFYKAYKDFPTEFTPIFTKHNDGL